MSHYWTALAMKQKGLQPSTKIVLYWLADHHNGVSGLCIPSQKRLADVCEMSDRSIRKHLTVLEGLGLIEIIERKRANGSQTSNQYRLLFDDQKIPPPAENISTLSPKNIPPHNLGTINQGILTKENKKDLFDYFWNQYPRQAKKKEAEKAFIQALQKISEKELKEVFDLQVFAYKKTDVQYIPYLHNWFNDERWTDGHLLKAIEARKKINKET